MLLLGYGLTETSPVSHLQRPEHSESKAGSIGQLHPNLEARLMNENDKGEDEDAAEGEPGELWIRGASVMKVWALTPIEKANVLIHFIFFCFPGIFE